MACDASEANADLPTSLSTPNLNAVKHQHLERELILKVLLLYRFTGLSRWKQSTMVCMTWLWRCVASACLLQEVWSLVTLKDITEMTSVYREALTNIKAQNIIEDPNEKHAVLDVGMPQSPVNPDGDRTKSFR